MEKVKCEICGMYINDRNLMLNNLAVLNKNDKTITSCPFCGVSYQTFSSYMPEDNKVLNERSMKIIDHAMKLEIFNSEFYREASILAQNVQLKQMFSELSKIEFMHAKIHQKLGGFQELPNIKKLDYSKYDKDEFLLMQAELRERHAVNYYSRYSSELCSFSLQFVFRALCQVEEEHIVLTSS